MWPSNPLTERPNLKFPIILAPMGIITTPSLAAAVGNEGGLGGIGKWGLTAQEAERHIAGFRQLSCRRNTSDEPRRVASAPSKVPSLGRNNPSPLLLGDAPAPRVCRFPIDITLCFFSLAFEFRHPCSDGSKVVRCTRPFHRLLPRGLHAPIIGVRHQHL